MVAPALGVSLSAGVARRESAGPRRGAARAAQARVSFPVSAESSEARAAHARSAGITRIRRTEGNSGESSPCGCGPVELVLVAREPDDSFSLKLVRSSFLRLGTQATLTRQRRGACQPGATPRERVRGTSSALQGRRIPAPLQGAPIDSETQGVALGYHAAAPSAPELKLHKPELRSFDDWPFIKWLPENCGGSMTTSPSQSLGQWVQLAGAFITGAILSLHHYAIGICFVAGTAAFYVGK